MNKAAAFYRELEPSTAMIFCSAERLINERLATKASACIRSLGPAALRLVEENVACLDSCAPHCSPQNWRLGCSVGSCEAWEDEHSE